MSQLKFRYQCLLVFLIIKLNFISGQICQNSDIPDFFYNIDFTGPIFDQSAYTISNISVSTPVNTTIYRFNVQPQTDYTRPSGLRLISDDISITSSHPSFTVVKIDDFSYNLVTKISPLDYFLPFNRYSFKLIATQIFSNQQRQSVISTVIVQINLVNDNAHSPIFVPDNQILYISEGTQINEIFGTVYATDADNDNIIYSITASSLFSIDQLTGNLRLAQRFDSSALAEYFLDITATDDGSSCLAKDSSCIKRSNSIRVQIIVTEINRNSPQFLNDVCGRDVSFDENSANVSILSLIVLDNDRGENGRINISFPSEELRTTVSGLTNTAYSQFYLEQSEQTNNTRRTILKTNEVFDYDRPGATRVWYLFILATDNGKPQRQTFCSLRINLRDVNDNPPIFLMTSWNYTIYRSSMNSPNRQFLRIIASDADSDVNGTINYFIRTIDVPYFAINRTTGRIILRNDILNLSTSLNTSRFPITFQVYAQDSGVPPLYSRNDATVTIHYSENDELPAATWLDPNYEDLNILITEKFYETHPHQPIYEEGGFNGSIFYRLTSNISSLMTVSSPFILNGELPFRDTRVTRIDGVCKSGITVTSGLHAEIQNIYVLYIRVLVNPPLIGRVTIRLKDENDQIPTFDLRSIILSVMENEEGNRTIAQIQAFDRDIESENNRISYRLNTDLTDTIAGQNFHVENNGAIWTDTKFSEQQTPYRLFITAYNNKLAWNSEINPTEDFQFDIQVISNNNKRPVINNGATIETIRIDETTKIGTDILNVEIIDEDIDTKINLGILNGNIRNTFTFTLLSTNSDNLTRTRFQAIGQLKVIAPLDFQLTSNYTLVLFVHDTKNTANITVRIDLNPQNTKAPYFNFMPGFTSYEYQVMENTPYAMLDGPLIRAFDPDSQSNLNYAIYDPRRQLDLTSLSLSRTGDHMTIAIESPGLSRDLPFGDSIYIFSIRVTDENGIGESSYASVRITVIDKNNKGPIPTNFPCIQQGLNSRIPITFVDYDDPTQDNTIPYRIQVVNPSNLALVGPTQSSDGVFDFVYNGILNRTITKHLTATFNGTDGKSFSQLTTIPLIVCDQLNTYPISDGSKTIKIVYVNGYENSIRNIDLGSIYVHDLNDWFRADRIYSITDVNNQQMFSISEGFIRTSQGLQPGFYTINVDVTKPNVPSRALSTINLEVMSIDSESVRQATTIRIQGEYPETLLDPSSDLLNNLRRALASVLSTNIYSILILSIHSVYQYKSPYDPPKPLDIQKNEALTDLTFYIPGSNKATIERTLNENLPQLTSSSQIRVIAIGSNIYNSYTCPIDTTCRLTRAIQPKPYVIDTNLTSFVGIHILDSPDCVNSTYPIELSDSCSTTSNNIFPDCRTVSSQYPGPIGPNCEVLGRIFDENGQGYAIYPGSTFSSFAPTRFSFDFILRSSIPNGLILLYGRNSIPTNDFFWIAIEIIQLKLKFYFRDTNFTANEIQLNSSTWYHVEYQILHSTILISINDCQYLIKADTTSNIDNLSNINLYLGGLPRDTRVYSLYPSLTSVDTFNGYIQNVLSNGNYLDMSKSLSSANSIAGVLPCTLTNSCSQEKRINDIIVPWYTWLIMVLVLLLLATILILTVLTCIRKRQQLKVLTTLYTDDTRDNIIDYKETAGEEDHPTYNLRVLKKPVYTLSDGNIIPNNNRLGYNDRMMYHRPSLGHFIEDRLQEQSLSYPYDTQLHYHYEGAGSIASSLSSIESPSLSDKNDYRFMHSLGPKFSGLANLYADHNDDDDNT